MVSSPTKSFDTMLEHLPAGAWISIKRLQSGRLAITAYTRNLGRAWQIPI
jgi:hypothetical protein